MIISQTLARAQPRRRLVDKPQFRGYVTDLIGSGLERSDLAGQPAPQAFLVEQPPNWELQSHFHLRHQFQVFIRGSGMLGKHAVGPLGVHYASPHSGYGPLVAGDEGIWYLTLRVVSDTAAWYLPDAREHLKLRIAKQQVHAGPVEREVDLASLEQAQLETVIELDSAGLGAWLMRLPAGATCDAPAGAESGSGRFYVVMKGSLHLEDEELKGLAAVFTGPTDPFTLRASASAEVLVLQFPAAALLVAAD